MMNAKFLAALFVFTYFAIGGATVSAQLDVGSAIGIDFSSAGGTASNWNTLASPNSSLSDPTTLAGDTLLGVSLTTSGVGGDNDAPDTSPNLTGLFPEAVQTDWWFEFEANSELVFTFSGLDNGLVYSLTIGSYRSLAVGDVRIDRGDTSWVVNGSTQTTSLIDLEDSYVTFTDLIPVNGVITISSTNHNADVISVVSALRLDVTGGEPTGLTGPPTPEVQPNELLFDPTDATVVDAVQPTETPNVVIIFADDWGYGDLSINGATLLSTPNIDQLAAEGRNFSDAHSTSAVCTPSRYGLYTGNYPFRARNLAGSVVGLNGPAGVGSPLLFNPATKTIGDVMKEAGYATSLIGKWHLGWGETNQSSGVGNPKWNSPLTLGPNDVGFDYYYGVPLVNSAPPYVFIENNEVVGLDAQNDPFVWNQRAMTESQSDWGGQDRGGKVLLDLLGGADAAHLLYRDRELSTHLTDRAKDWITQNQDDPFFMVLSTTAIHHPFTPAVRFEGTSLCGIYGDFVHELDYLVGEVTSHLQDLGELDNTLLIITSDNGGMSTNPPGTVALRDFEHRLNGNFLGAKFGVWEGGHRIPFIARWPGRIPAGTESDQMFSQVDLMRTLANFLDVGLAEEDARDSFDVIDVLTGDPSVAVRDAMFYSPNNNARRSIRMEDWVYIPASGDGGFSANIQRTRYLTDHYGIQYNHLSNGSIIAPNGTNSTQLYNLATDPYQQFNVVNDPANANLVSAMIALRTDILNGDRTAPVTQVILGDVNTDGSVNFFDISPFIALLTEGTYQEEADTNVDGLVNFMDIASFIALLTQ